jgi:hypothetical protein
VLNTFVLGQCSLDLEASSTCTTYPVPLKVGDRDLYDTTTQICGRLKYLENITKVTEASGKTGGGYFSDPSLFFDSCTKPQASNPWSAYTEVKASVYKYTG